MVAGRVLLDHVRHDREVPALLRRPWLQPALGAAQHIRQLRAERHLGGRQQRALPPGTHLIDHVYLAMLDLLEGSAKTVREPACAAISQPIEIAKMPLRLTSSHLNAEILTLWRCIAVPLPPPFAVLARFRVKSCPYWLICLVPLAASQRLTNAGPLQTC